MGLLDSLFNIIGSIKDAIARRFQRAARPPEKPPEEKAVDDAITSLETYGEDDKRLAGAKLLEYIAAQKAALTREYEQKMRALEAKEKQVVAKVPSLVSLLTEKVRAIFRPSPEVSIPRPSEMPSERTQKWLVDVRVLYNIYRKNGVVEPSVAVISMITESLLRRDVNAHIFGILDSFVGKELGDMRDGGFSISIPELITGEKTMITGFDIFDVKSARGEESRLMQESRRSVNENTETPEGYQEEYGQQEL